MLGSAGDVAELIQATSLIVTILIGDKTYM